MKPFNLPRVSLISFDLGRKLQRRHAAGRRFKLYGICSILFALFFIATLLTTLIQHGWHSFVRTEISVPLEVPLAISANSRHNDIDRILAKGLKKRLSLDTETQSDPIELLELYSPQSGLILHDLVEKRHFGYHENISIPASGAVDFWYKQVRFQGKSPHQPLEMFSQDQNQWLNKLHQGHHLHLHFNTGFFTHGDSQEPEIAGIYAALIGTLMTLSVAVAIAFPIGVATAIYLEELAAEGKFFDFLEININNLAAVPTIIFGLLGLAFFLNTLHLPRSASLVGGMTLSLVILPTIIIASRTALKLVPQSIRQASQGLGASKIQTVFHHVIPLAMPGMLTGTLLGLMRAMGESAPLLMLGMVAFIADPPSGFLDPATVLPVQIFSWAKNPSRGFLENTSAATLVLLLFLFIFNTLVIYLRQKFERKW